LLICTTLITTDVNTLTEITCDNSSKLTSTSDSHPGVCSQRGAIQIHVYLTFTFIQAAPHKHFNSHFPRSLRLDKVFVKTSGDCCRNILRGHLTKQHYQRTAGTQV